jgi:hypothetical protein
MPAVLIFEAAANATTTAVTTTPAGLDPASSAAAANATALSGVVPAIQNFASGFATNMSVVTLTMDNAAIDIGKAAVVFLIIVGVLLWFSRVNKRLGKELVEGGVIIGLFIEFAVPVLMSIHY